MAVTGWTAQPFGGGTRDWVGSEATTIVESSTGTYAGVLTRDANNSIGSDFTFQTKLFLAATQSFQGGLIFCYGSSSSFYFVGADSQQYGYLRLKKNDLALDGSSGDLAVASVSSLSQPTVKIVKRGANIKVYVDTVLMIDYTDASPIGNGKAGFAYPANWSTNTTFQFLSITDDTIYGPSGQICDYIYRRIRS